mmetsp:Transcript_3351/g.5245  ORF Transcript_3351/g.5245 Transcript_3351/m.5245 type:complete len:604 (+) Transcript_3351:129-1940(+)
MPRRVCYAHKRGECAHGDACKFIHSRSTGSSNSTGEVSVPHAVKDSSTKPPKKVSLGHRRKCYNYMYTGECARGDQCQYLHDVVMVQTQPTHTRAYVLMITGCGILSPDNHSFEKLLMSGGTGSGRDEMWHDISFTKHNFKWGQDEAAIEKIIANLRSGIYISTIICDLSCMSNQNHVRIFEERLGPTLRAYVHKGGCLAVTSFELGMVIDSLNRICGSNYERGGFYSAPCAPSMDNINAFKSIYPDHEGIEYYPKANFVRNVPLYERYISVSEPLEDYCEQSDTLVAIHKEGPNNGALAVFGDVNFEPTTCRLVHDFVMHKGIDCKPPPSFNAQDEVELQGPPSNSRLLNWIGKSTAPRYHTDDKLERSHIEYTTLKNNRRSAPCKQFPRPTNISSPIAGGSPTVPLRSSAVLLNPHIPESFLPRICSYCRLPGAKLKCTSCFQYRFCSPRCIDLAASVHRIVCRRNVEDLERNWRTTPYDHRRMLQEYPGYFQAPITELLNRCRERAERAFDAITANDIHSLHEALQWIDVNTTSDEAGLAVEGGLPAMTTLLAYASQQDGKVRLMSSLLHFGANPNLLDVSGKSVFTRLREIYRLQVNFE